MTTNRANREYEERMRAKGSDRIEINNLLSAICVAALFFLLSVSQTVPNGWIVAQLALAIPLLVTSSLAYAKTCYRDFKEFFIWDKVGWVTHSIGYILILNATFLLIFQSKYISEAWIFLGSVIALFVSYSVVDFLINKRRFSEKIYKLGFYLALLTSGSIVPLFFLVEG